MNKTDIKSLSKSELETVLEAMGEARYRAAQIWRWLFKVGVKSFDGMSDIPSPLRETLKKRFHITHPALLDSKSSKDGTTKYLFKLEDANTIETVFLPEGRRNTICLSSQVGCKFGCVFCASSAFGFVRNLKVSEILDEVLYIKSRKSALPITNLVFMGIGEPLDNYDNLIGAIRVFNDKAGFNMGARKITISTCGLLPGIERLKEEGLQVELSISLHSADDVIRSRLVPINKRYPLKSLMEACRSYTEATKRIITFEYVLIKDVNSSKADALKLAGLLKGMKCKVNTISYNQIKAKGYEGPSKKEIEVFVKTLKDNGINITHRKSKGEGIDAGCGQLRIGYNHV
ncbi:MAG: 23S rRNA (adenine(2503)-C(2))-methyltransferase RlmN [Candidatus Omnitrophica bacterium]|nr:23S rRNA (adenine(2503)-C(2))-methyltransferase RlmN [Candidatus Omnitrophota bacterium]